MLAQTSEDFRRAFLLEFTKQLIKNSSQEDIYKLATVLKEEKKIEKEGLKEAVKEKEKEIKEKSEIVNLTKELPLQPSIVKENPPVPPKPLMIPRNVVPVQPRRPPSFFAPQTIRKGLIKPIRIEESELRPSPILTQRQQTRPRTEAPVQINAPYQPQQVALPQRLQHIKPMPTKDEINLDKLNPFVKDPMVRVIECKGPGEEILVKGSMGAKRTGVVLNELEIEDIVNNFSQATKIPIQEGFYKVAFGSMIFTAVISDVTKSRFIITKMTPYQQAPANTLNRASTLRRF